MIPPSSFSTRKKKTREQYAAYCTKVSSHTISAPTLPWGIESAPPTPRREKSKDQPGPPMFLMPNAGVSSRSHQALAGSTGPRTSRGEERAGWGFEDSSEFLICKGSQRWNGAQGAEDRGSGPAVVCSKETQHWQGWHLRERKEEERREVSQEKMESCGCVLTAFWIWCGSWFSAAAVVELFQCRSLSAITSIVFPQIQSSSPPFEFSDEESERIAALTFTFLLLILGTDSSEVGGNFVNSLHYVY